MTLPTDDPDFLAGKAMPIGEHIEDLRIHLLRALKGFGLAFIASLFLGSYVLDFITAPVIEQLNTFAQRQLATMRNRVATEPRLQELNQPEIIEREVNVGPLAGRFGLPAGSDEWLTLPTRSRPLDEALKMKEALLIIDGPTLVVFKITETLWVLMQVCLGTALVLGSPWIFYQIWAFVAEGLYPGEKRVVYLFLPFSLGLFLAGICLCQFVVMPKAIEYLLWFNEWQGFRPELRLNEWLGFAILLPLIFGIAFQTPVVMLLLHMLGLVPVDFYRGKRKAAWFTLAVAAAVITPTGDPINFCLLWVPLVLLYEFGIALCLFLPRRLRNDHAEESQNLIEV